MTALERIVPAPGLLEIEGVDLALPIERAWELLRHGDLARSRVVHALFAIRTIPDRLRGKSDPMRLRIDDLISSDEHPGFQILADAPPHEIVVGAIGKVWEPEIEFRHVPTADAFASFEEPDFVKVAWALQLTPLGEQATRVTFELRVALTDEAGLFRSYKIVDPSFHNWNGLALALRGQAISDFPLCNKSFNLSYCGFDL